MSTALQPHHLEVRRTARYYTLGAASAPEAWIVCHGYSQLARYFLRSFTPLDDGSRFVIAPEALNRYYSETSPGVHASDARIGATWMTREDRDVEIGDYVAYLDQLSATLLRPDQRVIALGFSQGAATVSRWAALGGTRIDDLVLWGTGPAHDLELASGRFRDARVTIVAGESDEYFDSARAERTAAKLKDAGIVADVLGYSGGHRIVESALTSLAERLRSR